MPGKVVYNAINGTELKESVLNEIQRILDGNRHFSQSKTYPVVSWHWKLEIDVYPSSPPHIEVEASGESDPDDLQPDWDDEGIPPEGCEPPEKIKAEGGRDDIGSKVPPDQVREEENLGEISIPPTKDHTGRMVDKVERPVVVRSKK